MRPLCPSCQTRPKAINYYKGNTVYYRKFCESCAKNDGKIKGVPRWFQLGYRKKEQCEKCGYKSKHPEQFNVLFVDGDLNNCRPANLKTVCANCQRILQKEGVKWRQGDLLPDF